MIQLLSFSKSFGIPGHRLGALVAHPSLMATVDQPLDPTKDVDAPDQRPSNIQVYGPVAKVLDDLQISPPVGSTQEVVAWALGDAEMRSWRSQEAQAIEVRRQRFAAELARLPVHSVSGEEAFWAVESSGGYYAYVHHPWGKLLDSQSVARALATLVGVKTLPGAFFMPPDPSSQPDPDLEAALAEMSEEDRASFIRGVPTPAPWRADDPADRLRFSVANVDLPTLLTVPERLVALDRFWAEKGVGYGL